MKTLNTILLVAILLLSHSVMAKDVGTIKYARGAVTAQQEDGSGARLIGRGDHFKEGEILKTGSKSFAIITLADDTRMTLRPSTSFAVEKMNATKDSSASALLRLFKGGLRAITGFISKKNPRGYRLRTSVATIGIRGTEFDARICDDDCAKENKKHAKLQQRKQEKMIGRVVYKRGSMNALDFSENKRKLKSSSHLFEGDTLKTGKNSYAVIVFKDKSRISLKANSVFRIDKLKYDKKEPEQSRGFFSLLKGGLRAVTGFIGKLKRKNYRMRTHVATIGIRGTDYILSCTGACSPDVVTSGIRVGDELPSGLYVNVVKGGVVLGDTIVQAGKAAFVKNITTPPVILPRIPKAIQAKPEPKLKQIKKKDLEFTAPKEEEAPPGLYVSVTEGEITLVSDNSNQKQVITKGQAAFTDVKGLGVKALPTIPAFQKLDNFPTPENFKAKAVDISGGIIGKDGKEIGCEIK